MQPLTNNHCIILATIIPQNKMVWTALDNTLMASINDNYLLVFFTCLELWRVETILFHPTSMYF